MDMAIVWKVLLVGGLALAGVASRFVLKMKRDNQIEEAAEWLIKQQTGRDIDLSPDNPDGELSAQEAIKEASEFVAHIRNPESKISR